MNILFDIGHPAHVHLFRHTAKMLEARGHTVYYSMREIPVAKRLMDVYGMPYINLGGKRSSIFGKLLTIIRQDLRLLWFVWRHHIDIGISCGIVLPHVSRLSKMASIVCDDDDDEAEPLEAKFAHPFAQVVFTPEVISRKTSHKITYPGTHELAYLHPKQFVSDASVLQRAGIQEGEPFFVMRFVAFNGHHDVGAQGISLEQKRRLIALLKPHGRVIITSERAIEPEFEQYRLPVPPEDIHSLMYYASLFVGDSQTMTSEAALLGVPALKCNTFAHRLSVPNLMEKYGLCYSYLPTDFEKMYAQIETLLHEDNLKELWQVKLKSFLKEMINPTELFVWFVENYPQSEQILRATPEYLNRFKG